MEVYPNEHGQNGYNVFLCTNRQHFNNNICFEPQELGYVL